MLKYLSNIFNHPDCILNRKFRHQFLATLTVNIFTLSHGIGLGWLSPTIVALQSPETPVAFTVDIVQASWIGSLLGLGSLTGNLTFGTLVDLIGRKASIYLIAVPHICLWILIYSAQSVEFLYIARFLGGFGGGSCYVVFPIFLSEIADSNIRGTFAVTLMLSVNLGILIGFILSTHLSYFLMPMIIVGLPIIYLIISTYFPETPQHLLRKGKYIAAEDSFKFYKNCSNNYEDLHKCNVEFEELKEQIMKCEGGSRLSFKDFSTKPALKAFALAIVIMIANQFSGNFAFVNYMSLIFKETGSPLDPNTCTIIMGAVQISGAYAATIFVDRYGRKILMLLSTGGVAVGLIAFGLYTFYTQHQNLTELSWLPLVIMSFVIFLCNMGIVALTFVLLVEIFPAKIRSFGASFCMAGLSFMVFTVLKIFPLYLDQFGVSITMWSCATVSGLCFIYLLIFLPETKGKSMNAD